VRRPPDQQPRRTQKAASVPISTDNAAAAAEATTTATVWLAPAAAGQAIASRRGAAQQTQCSLKRICHDSQHACFNQRSLGRIHGPSGAEREVSEQAATLGADVDHQQ
jgi:hypothetical protein